MFSDWKQIAFFKKPTEEIAKTTAGDGLKNLIVSSFLLALIGAITITVQFFLFPSHNELGDLAVVGSAPNTLGLMISWAMLIVLPILTIIFSVIFVGIVHIILKIMGGKGSYGNFLGATAKISAAFQGTWFLLIAIILLIATAVIGITSPTTVGLAELVIVSALMSLIQLLVGILAIIPTIKVTKIIHSVGTGKAIIAWVVIPIILIFVLVVGLVIVGLFLQVMAPTPGLY